ncbi:MAG: GNAT family N-acetyltransferase [Acidobacteria bacterium]|nr:GNAT family N-acetyltransferase [Acidobacteriota bacterium]
MVTLPGPPVRLWRSGDEESLVRHADNYAVWRSLRDRFPRPYTLDDARRWIEAQLQAPERLMNFAIERHGEAVGGVGFIPGSDVESRTAEIGYWVGQSLWGRGLATAAVQAVLPYAFERLELLRVFAAVFELNPASARVLEKAGFVREGVLRDAAIKEGRVTSMIVYGMTLSDWDAVRRSGAGVV